MFEDWIAKLRKRLYVLNFIVINHCELAERTITIGLGRIRTESSGRKASFVRTSDDGVQIGVHDVEVGIEHGELVVIQQRLATCCGSGFRCCHVDCRNLRAIPFSAFWFDVDAAEQSFGKRSAITFATRRGSAAVHEVVPFARGEEGVDG